MKQLPDGAGQLLEDGDYLGARMFERMARDRFPELRDDPDISNGIHLCMAALARVTMHAIHAGQSTKAAEVFGFLGQVLQQSHVHHDIHDAIAQSYVVASELLATPVGQTVWTAAPKSVRMLLHAREGQGA
jgi:hypothetical protein